MFRNADVSAQTFGFRMKNAYEFISVLVLTLCMRFAYAGLRDSRHRLCGMFEDSVMFGNKLSEAAIQTVISKF